MTLSYMTSQSEIPNRTTIRFGPRQKSILGAAMNRWPHKKVSHIVCDGLEALNADEKLLVQK